MTNSKANVTLLFLLVSSTFLVRHCHADMIIRIDNTTFQAGSTGAIDIWGRSTITDAFDLLNYEIKIETIASIGGSLEFQPSFDSLSPIRQNNSEQSDTKYIFAGNTVSANFSAARQDNKVSLVGTDFVNGGPITINAPDEFLLARVELQHITPTPITSSGSFRVSLVENPMRTFFLNSAVDTPDQPKIDPVSFSIANSGIVTITAVPEPSSIFLLASIGGFFLWQRRRIYIIKN
jgi:hypothetical protein